MSMTMALDTEACEPIFDHRGPITEGMIAATSQSLRSRLVHHERANDGRARKVFSSYVELAYNILCYGHPDGRMQDSHRYGEIRVRRCGDVYHITAKNRVSRAAATELAERLERLRGMSADEIRSEFRTRLISLQFEDNAAARLGAGLGLITVARNSDTPLAYRILREDESETCIFSIHAMI